MEWAEGFRFLQSIIQAYSITRDVSNGIFDSTTIGKILLRRAATALYANKFLKNEKCADKLTIMPKIRLLDVQESLARAIAVEEEPIAVEKQTSIPTPAFPKDINFTQARTGMHCRQYLGSRKSKNFETARGGKDPIRNYMRLLCRLRLSDSHLLRECPKLSSAEFV